MKSTLKFFTVVIVLLGGAANAEIITMEFKGTGEGPTQDYAIDTAIADAKSKAFAAGYGNCKLTQYAYYPYDSSWYASAWMDCTRDTTPPPPPPAYCPTISIQSPVRDGTNHTIYWSLNPNSRLLFNQRINGGEWKMLYKGETRTSWTTYNANPGVYEYQLLAEPINGSGSGFSCSSSIVSITVSSPPAMPLISQPEPAVRTSYRITWSSSPNADQYILEQGLEDGGWISSYVGPLNYLDVKNSAPGEYGFRVRACQNSACSQPSPTQIYTVRSIDSVIGNYIINN